MVFLPPPSPPPQTQAGDLHYITLQHMHRPKDFFRSISESKKHLIHCTLVLTVFRSCLTNYTINKTICFLRSRWQDST